jgi:hypothetical protein
VFARARKHESQLIRAQVYVHHEIRAAGEDQHLDYVISVAFSSSMPQHDVQFLLIIGQRFRQRPEGPAKMSARFHFGDAGAEWPGIALPPAQHVSVQMVNRTSRPISYSKVPDETNHLYGTWTSH